MSSLKQSSPKSLYEIIGAELRRLQEVEAALIGATAAAPPDPRDNDILAQARRTFAPQHPTDALLDKARDHLARIGRARRLLADIRSEYETLRSVLLQRDP